MLFGIVDTESEQEDEYNELKAEFPGLFTNNIDNLQIENLNIEKISNDYDIVATAYTYKKNSEKCTLNAVIPYMNIKKQIPTEFNKIIKSQFKNMADELEKSELSENVIYTVSYKTYIQNDIVSLVIRSELKEGAKSQKIVIKTFNYNIREDKEVTLQEFLQLKNINIQDANEKIKKEIKKVQEQNESLEEALEDRRGDIGWFSNIIGTILNGKE